MDGNMDTHQQRKKDDNKGTQPAMKLKLDEEEISKTQDASNKMMLEEEKIPTSQVAANTMKREEDIPKSQDAAKRRKLQEESPKSQDAASKMKLEEDITKSQCGTDTENIRDTAHKVWYSIFVKYEYVTERQASGEDSMSVFRGVLRDAGCSESLIDPRYITKFHFWAQLIPEEVRKLSDLDNVRGLQPDGFFKAAY